MIETGTVSETPTSFKKITNLSARDFSEFSRRESFKTQNKNLLLRRQCVLEHCHQYSGRKNCLSLRVRRFVKSGHPELFVTDRLPALALLLFVLER
jgi:hypothetical protein